VVVGGVIVRLLAVLVRGTATPAACGAAFAPAAVALTAVPVPNTAAAAMAA
jgi:hypothetical protein